MKIFFAECQKKTLGKEPLCRVSKKKHSAKKLFAECFFYTPHRGLFTECIFLPSVFDLALGKELLY
jgi:hypothetical protein